MCRIEKTEKVLDCAGMAKSEAMDLVQAEDLHYVTQWVDRTVGVYERSCADERRCFQGQE